MSATVAGRRRPVASCTTGCNAVIVEALCLLLGFVLVVWSITPIYNMW